MTACRTPLTLNKEVKLAETRAERDLQESLAEVFSIIITLDELEKAYLKDAIPESDYTEICDRLLKQYKAILIDDAVAKEFVDLETFKNEWDVCIAVFMVLVNQMLIIIDGGTSGYGKNSHGSSFYSDGAISCSYNEQQRN
jgi:VPS28 protein